MANIEFVDHIRVRVRICHGQVLSASTNLPDVDVKATVTMLCHSSKCIRGT
jgi:hypothetical protein